MDGLSGAASVIAVLQLATAVGSALKDYYEGVRDAREDIGKLYGSIKGLEGILERLKDVAKGLNDETLLLLTQPLEGVRAELGELGGKLHISEAETRARRALKSLHLGFEQFDITADIRADIRLARIHEDRRRIVGWLSEGIPNPSQEHNVARERHEETTGSWLVNDSNGYLGWLTAPNSFLWLNGGAGAGKSILCKYFPDLKIGIIKEHERANVGQQKPTLKSCIAMLREVISGFDNVYIVLDALDECPKVEDKRHKLLSLLHDVCDWNLSSLHILVTSRREPDIIESFTSCTDALDNFTSIIAAGPQIEDDIKKYLRRQLQSSLFKNWKKSLKRDVELALASKADGMSYLLTPVNITKFRLVALQLEALSKLRAESKIRSALENLPKTLDAFYDRIILEITDEDQEYANRALQWIAFAARPLSLKELAEAVIISPEHEPCLRDEDRLMDSKDLLDIIPSGLIRTVRVELGRDDTIEDTFDSSSEQEDTDEEESNELSDSSVIESKSEDDSRSNELSDSRVIESVDSNGTESVGGGDIESGDDSRSHGSFTSAGYANDGTKLIVHLASYLWQNLKLLHRKYLKTLETLRENLLMQRSLLGSIRPLLGQGVSDVIADVRK
ncbi:hypothetical protein LARI1_G002429 [Lachnellula arida]|uniref:Nephrocystin 3-like N-terminal domain-containing protein n=1 Tax=Lachnellula arida TaxID=1316785 RepID=A0A8T9BG86_9HELO|nr:hypothetical protein LARI1_G002429 [Lachnellula arida]